MNLKYALRSEDTEQIAVITWAQWNMQRYPELELLHHVPNGGSRNKAEAVKLKQMGVKAGVPDLHLPVPKAGFCGLYIEMKYGKNKPTQAQNEWLDALREQGYFTAVCYGFYETVNTIRQYLQGGKA